ncbi:MAG: efflux RND transporter periplasmic adaptor subunit [Syntrophales bacterium]
MRLAVPNKRVLVVLAALAVLFTLLTYVALSSGPLAKIPVTVTTVEKKQITASLFGTGTIEARYNYKIGPTAAGRLKSVNVQVGESVRSGQVLGEMDPVDLDERISALNAALMSAEAAISSAEARLKEASFRNIYADTQKNRYRQLVDVGSASVETHEAKRLESETAETGFLAARSNRDAALHDLSRIRFDRDGLVRQRANLLLTAPARGLVVARNADPGATLSAGQTAIEIIDPGSVWINVHFDQIRTEGLRPGLKVKITLRSQNGRVFTGRVFRIEPLADSVTEETLAKVQFDPPPERMPAVGELAEITITLAASPPAPVVPNASLHRIGGRLGVWLIREDSLHFTPVEIGAADLEGQTQIREGLKIGDRIVVHTPRALNTRSRIRIVDRLPGVDS